MLELERRASGVPLWLDLEPHPVHVSLHLPPREEDQRETAVLICPPFGWDEMCSFRARRSWATELAQSGYPAGRLDLPGTGDSAGGPGTSGLIDHWTTAVARSADWLRATTGAERVAVVGLGLSGLIACRAAAEGAAIDELVLWGASARGRAMLRELRAYAAVVAARYAEDAREPPGPPGGVEVTGFLLTAETARALEALDLTALELPDGVSRRVLLIGRGALGVDRRLQGWLEAGGKDVTVLGADDYDSLIAHPQAAQTPEKTIRATIDWLALATGAGVPRPGDPPVSATRSAVLHEAAGAVRETPISFEIDSGRLSAVLSEPVDVPTADVCAVLLNGGALHRIGPNRTWVEVARRWAARGVPSVRVDFEGIGESDGDATRHIHNDGLYSPRTIAETIRLLDDLAGHGLPQRFVLVGLCSGAYWALHSALEDQRVVGAFMVNLYTFYWSPELVAERDRRETMAALRRGLISRLRNQGVTREQVQRALRGVRSRFRLGSRSSVEGAQAAEVVVALDALSNRGTETLLLLSRAEPVYEQFEREGWIAELDRWPNLHVELIPSTDHNVRAIWLQQLVHERLDSALERLLARS